MKGGHSEGGKGSRKDDAQAKVGILIMTMARIMMGMMILLSKPSKPI